MRNFTTLVILFLCAIPSFINAQFIDSVYQFSTGNNDYNPRFPVYTRIWDTYNKEYFVFERHISTSYTRICIGAVGSEGLLDSIIMISENNSININPVIAYNGSTNHILISWETFKNGSWDVYAKYFTKNSWSKEFPIDSSSADARSPEIVCYDSSNFAIVYEKEGDILFREIDITNHTITSIDNITSADTILCSNPYISLTDTDYKPIISYERNYSPSYVPIYFKVRTNSIWSSPKIVTATGVNKNSGFPTNDGSFGILSSYERIDSLTTSIYITYISAAGNNIDSLSLTPDPFNNYSSFSGGRPYIIRNGLIYLPISGFVKDDLFNKKALFFSFEPNSQTTPDLEINLTPEFSFDSLETLMITSGGVVKVIPNGSCRVYWFLFNKSETGQYQSRIHGIKFENCIHVNITPISSEIPATFSLKQNYPNPFNPATKIRFDIPGSLKQVKLSIYNSIGQEISVLLDEHLQPGIYEYDFNASSYPSGVYFYRLEAGEFSETKRMVLIK